MLIAAYFYFIFFYLALPYHVYYLLLAVTLAGVFSLPSIYCFVFAFVFRGLFGVCNSFPVTVFPLICFLCCGELMHPQLKTPNKRLNE